MLSETHRMMLKDIIEDKVEDAITLYIENLDLDNFYIEEKIEQAVENKLGKEIEDELIEIVDEILEDIGL